MKKWSRRRVYPKQKSMNEVDAGRDRATPAWVRHDDDETVQYQERAKMTETAAGRTVMRVSTASPTVI
jgi:hypothetical protein